MKKIFLLPAFASLLLWSACKEKPVEIPFLGVGTRRVLAEEVTGVACSNCPDGARTLVSLQNTFKSEGRELIVVSIHAAGNFSKPYPNNLYDFRTSDGQALVNYIGALEGFPSAAIDRLLLPNETSTFINPHTRWEGVIRSEFGKDYGLEILLSNQFDPASRQLNIQADLVPDQTLSGDNRLSVLITQDSIVDLQNDNNVFNPNYIHRHVLRDVVTSAEGDAIAEPLVKGSIIHKNFSVALPVGWDERHCSVVAFVHRGGNPDKEVLQAAERHVIE